MRTVTLRLTPPLCAALLVGACGARSADQGSAEPVADDPVAMPARDSLCAGIANVYECAQQVEEQRLARMARYVRRTGDTLVIPLLDGQDVTLVDQNAGGPDNVFYTYREHLDEIGYHVVDVHYYEGGSHLLIGDETGQRVQISAPPVVSPGGNRLVVASAGGTAGYAPDELQVWRITPAGVTLEWEVQPGWGATNARWEDRRTIRFRITRECPDQPVCYQDAVLRLRDGEWTLETNPGDGTTGLVARTSSRSRIADNQGTP